MRSGWKTAILIALIVAAAGATPVTLAPIMAQPPEDPRLSCDIAAPPPATLPGARSLTYATAPSRELRLHVFSPGNAATANGATGRPAIVFFFGGGWRTGTPVVFADRARTLAAEGYVAILPRLSRDMPRPDNRHRFCGGCDCGLSMGCANTRTNSGSIHRESCCRADRRARISRLPRPSRRRSREKPAALVLFNPAVDLVSIAGRIGLTPEAAAPVSLSVLPVDALPPTIAFHGDADTTVLIQTVRDFCKRAMAAGRRCELKEYAGKGHGFFQSRDKDPALGGASPYEDTLARAIAFLAAQGITGPVR
jgi:acetyl esterase